MGRKRANTPIKGNKIEVPVKPKSSPLIKGEVQYFQELIDTSNRYTSLRQQKEGYEFAVKKLEEKRKEVQDGKIKLPILLPFIPKHSWYMEEDKKKIFQFLDEEIGKLKGSIKALEGQMQHRYDEYTESAVRNREFLNKRYKNLAAKQIAPDRKEIKDEENLFEAEFNELIKNEQKKEEFKRAKMEAIKRNTQRATKKDE